MPSAEFVSGPFLALDWGTTNLRAWVVGERGEVLRHREFPLGVSRLARGEAAKRFQDQIRPAMEAEDLPALLCGMIGSNLGWETVPYLDCPVGLRDLAGALHRVEAPGPAVAIVPGLRCERPDGGPDVMRGEEVHVLGWIVSDPERARGRHLVCHPGTHAKWVCVVDGRIERFVTAMTGELFDVLRRHSVLQVRDSDDDDSAFDEGLQASVDGDALASRLFTARSRVVGGTMSPDHVKSYLSGLLIGAETASLPRLLGVEPGGPVAVIGDLRLAARYRRALERRGARVSVHDGEGAVVRGLQALVAEEARQR